MGKKATILPRLIRPMKNLLSDEDEIVASDYDSFAAEQLEKEYISPNYFDMSTIIYIP